MASLLRTAATVLVSATLAGCAVSAAPSAPRSPAVAPTHAATPALSPAARLSANARVCRALTTGPGTGETAAGMRRAARTLSLDAAKTGVTTRLADALESLAARIQALLLGVGTPQQTQTWLHRVEALCKQYEAS